MRPTLGAVGEGNIVPIALTTGDVTYLTIFTCSDDGRRLSGIRTDVAMADKLIVVARQGAG